MNQDQINYELKLFAQDLIKVEQAPLKDRKEAKEEFQKYLEDIREEGFEPMLRNIGWILNGSYGAGVLLAWNMTTKRTNRRAWLFTRIAALDHQVTRADSAKIWHGLTLKDQSRINAGLDKLIQENDQEREEGTACIV